LPWQPRCPPMAASAWSPAGPSGSACFAAMPGPRLQSQPMRSSQLVAQAGFAPVEPGKGRQTSARDQLEWPGSVKVFASVHVGALVNHCFTSWNGLKVLKLLA
jgi:hypothetical protein